MRMPSYVEVAANVLAKKSIAEFLEYCTVALGDITSDLEDLNLQKDMIERLQAKFNQQSSQTANRTQKTRKTSTGGTSKKPGIPEDIKRKIIDDARYTARGREDKTVDIKELLSSLSSAGVVIQASNPAAVVSSLLRGTKEYSKLSPGKYVLIEA